MATSLSSILGGIYTGPSGFSGFSGVSGYSGYSGAGISGFSGFSGAGTSGFSGVSGYSGYSGIAFNGGTITNPLIVSNATVATSAGSGALQVTGGTGFGSDIYLSGKLFNIPDLGSYVEAIPIKKVALVTNVSISSSVVANLSGFSFPLSTVGATYMFQFYVLYSGATTNAALGAALSFPGAVNFAATFRSIAGTAGTAGQYTVPLLSTGVKAQSLSVAVINNNYLAVVEGTIVVSTSGTLQLQLSNSLNATTTSQVTVKRGTTGWLWRMA